MKLKFYLLKSFVFVLTFSLAYLLMIHFFKPVFEAEHLIFPYAVHPFDIVQMYPETWIKIKHYYVVCFSISYFIIFKNISKRFHINTKKLKRSFNEPSVSDLKLLVGSNENTPVYIDESGLYQNILITGTIGTGKTSSAMYPFTKQLIKYKANNNKEKISMLILDVKGNYFSKVLEFANEFGRLNDVIAIDLSGNYTYNPLDKPYLSPIVLANRLKTILSLFSPNNSESYWLDKAEQVLAEAIKFCRLYNNGYVTFTEIHKLIMFTEYYSQKLSVIKSLFKSGRFSNKDSYNLLSCIDFFEKEFFL